MKRTIISLGALAALAFPGAALAAEKPAKQDRRNAAQECRFLRGSTDESREAFRSSFRTFGQCVSSRAREERSERQQARRNAAQTCRAMRSEQPEEFARFRNFGQCVSQQARQNEREEDAEDRQEARATKNAAKQCAALREEQPGQFRERFGSRRNAFGRCVSQTARAQQEQEQEQEAPAPQQT